MQHIDEDIERRFADVRKEFGLKRRELEVGRAEQQAFLRTGQFEYCIECVEDAEQDDTLTLRRELSQFQDLALLRTTPFRACFDGLFDTLVCDFETLVPIENLVDRIEALSRSNLGLTYDSRCEWCELTLEGFPGTVRFEGERLTISQRQDASAESLSELLKVVKKFFE